MISTRGKGKKIKCIRCNNINFYNMKEDVFDGEHRGERCVKCESCGKVITLKKQF